MSRERGARASIPRSVLHGIVGWGIMLSLAAGILLSRLHTAEAARAPLPLRTAVLTQAEYRQWTSFPRYHRVVPVLMYHSIGGRASYLTTTRRLFEEQMRALKVAGFHTLTIEQYAQYVEHGPAGLPSRPILLTFDDGRLDAYRAANDLLKAYGFHATELAVPAWVMKNPDFSLSWPQMAQMARGRVWDVQLHFGYGKEEIRYNKAGNTGAAFGYREYIPGQDGRPGHEETFAQFKQRLANNMEWGVQQFRKHIPGYKPWSMAIPESDYGQDGNNDPRIPPFDLRWLNAHFPVVFGGDYLDKATGRKYQLPGRFSRELSYRMTMGPQDILPALHCRLYDYIHRLPAWMEYGCLHLVPDKVVTSTAHPAVHPLKYTGDGPPPPPHHRVVVPLIPGSAPGPAGGAPAGGQHRARQHVTRAAPAGPAGTPQP